MFFILSSYEFFLRALTRIIIFFGCLFFIVDKQLKTTYNKFSVREINS
nr:MAG TPA: hypothetical protein [Caudoviricetes sp.]